MQRERAVVAEAIECASSGELTDQYAILALIEKGPGLCAPPWCGRNPHAVLGYFDLVGDRTAQQLDANRELLFGAKRHVVSREYPVRMNEVVERVHDDVAKRLQPGAHQLHHEPTLVPVANERRTTVPLAVNQSVGACGVSGGLGPLGGGAETSPPPGRVEHRGRVVVDEPKGD